MAIHLDDDTRRDLIASIQLYFQDEREEEIGELQAAFLLDFILAEVGPSIYNRAIQDAQSRLNVLVAELDVSLHEPEFGYSAERPGRGRGRGR